MNIEKSTNRFEEWLATQTSLIKADLRLKHRCMAEGVFPFFRATFYRWMQLWPDICPDLAKAPHLLAIGDLHVENFGTWRDIEGRLVWGVNDFDEAAELPYAIDLVRLAASASLAIAGGQLKLKFSDACESILAGYKKAMQDRSSPFVLEEDHHWLRLIANGELRDPVHFWQKMNSASKARGFIPRSAKDGLEQALPEHGLQYRLFRRVAGAGSLGRQRLVALAQWHGATIAREAKALVPSAAHWMKGTEAPGEIFYQTIVHQAVRCPDPFLQLRGHWIVRRLSPDCSRVELSSLPRNRDECRLLSAMGRETANIHLGSKAQVKTVRHHLEKLEPGWLSDAAGKMVKAITADWREWAKSHSA